MKSKKKESSILSYYINKTNNDVIFPPDSPENQHQKHFMTSARSTNAFSPRIKILILLIGGSSFRIKHLEVYRLTHYHNGDRNKYWVLSGLPRDVRTSL